MNGSKYIDNSFVKPIFIFIFRFLSFQFTGSFDVKFFILSATLLFKVYHYNQYIIQKSISLYMTSKKLFVRLITIDTAYERQAYKLISIHLFPSTMVGRLKTLVKIIFYYICQGLFINVKCSTYFMY